MYKITFTRSQYMEKSEILKAFGNNVRCLRIKKGLSQEQLADLAGLHRTYIGGIERGERNISLENIVKIAKALGIDPTTLLGGIR